MSLQEIQKEFGDDLDSKLLEECINICKFYNLSAEDLRFKWEAATMNFSHTFKTQAMRPFDMEAVATIKATLQRDLAEKKKQTPRTGRLLGTPMMSRGNRLPNFMNRRPGPSYEPSPSPNVNVKSEDIEMSMSLDPMSTLAAKVTFKGMASDPEARKKRAYRYMYEKVLERSEVLDTQIEDFADRIRSHYHVELNSDPAASTDEEVFVVGRITQDTDQSTSAKLDESVLLIDTSRGMGSGTHRVPIRFEPSLKIRGGAKGAGALSVFPGALVALKGKNGGGGWFSISEILAPPVLRTDPSTKPEPHFANTSFFTIVCAGPYTADKDLEFKPWKSFLTLITSKRPAVLILIGPFIDATHQSLVTGDIECSPLQLFKKQFTKPIRAFLNSSPGSIAVLVPSVRDIVNTHVVFPQAEFESNATENDARIHLVSNPGHFTINDISFSVTSADVVYHIKTQEFTVQGEEVDSLQPRFQNDVDAMANACRHLLLQRSFYPLFPVPQEESQYINLDVTHSAGLEITSAPDVLIVPSRLRHFVKNLDGTTAINPSSLVKGSFGMIDVVPGSGSTKSRIQAKADKIDVAKESGTI